MSRPDFPADARDLAAGLKAAVACELRAGLRLTAGKAPEQAAPEPEALEAVRRDLGNCSRCSLCDKRNEIVFGAGSPLARLAFIGIAPSAADDAGGQPFCGEDGELLSNMIKAMHRSRTDVYLTHIVKCAPEGGRLPHPAEIAACLPFVLRQLSSIGPAVVCALGQAASQALLGTGLPLEQLRGRFHPCRGFLVMPTYDPPLLMQQPALKRQAWDDLKLVMRELDRMKE